MHRGDRLIPPVAVAVTSVRGRSADTADHDPHGHAPRRGVPLRRPQEQEQVQVQGGDTGQPAADARNDRRDRNHPKGPAVTDHARGRPVTEHPATAQQNPRPDPFRNPCRPGWPPGIHAHKATVGEAGSLDDIAAATADGLHAAGLVSRGSDAVRVEVLPDGGYRARLTDVPAAESITASAHDQPESTFATVRRRTKVTKRPGSRAAGLAMAFKLIESAQDRWRAVNAPHLVALVRAGATFINGKLVERPGGNTEPEAA